MKKLLSLLLVFALGSALAPVPVLAATTSDVLAALRGSLRVSNSLTKTADEYRRHAIVEEIKQASAKVDAQVAAVEADPATTVETKAKLQEFKLIWADYQKTRDEEIIPAYLAGDLQKAEKIRVLVQTGRFQQMMNLLRWRPS